MKSLDTAELLRFDADTLVETKIGLVGQPTGFSFAFNPVPVPRAGGGEWPVDTLFAIDQDGWLRTIDPETAESTLIGNTGLDRSGLCTFALDGRLFMSRRDGPTFLYEIDTVTAEPTKRGFVESGALFGAFTTFPTDTSVEGFGVVPAGRLLAVDQDEVYYVIDPDTIEYDVVLVGDLAEIPEFAPDGTLFAANFDGGIYRVDLDPFSETLIGSASSRVNTVAIRTNPFTLEVETTCPELGPATFTARGGVGGEVGFAFSADGPGTLFIPSLRVCPGTRLGLDAPVFVRGTAFGDPAVLEITEVNPAFCDRVVAQALDLETCSASNVIFVK